MIVRAAVSIALIVTIGCREGREGRESRGGGDVPNPQSPAPNPDARPAIVFLGTSLTAGYGVGPEAAGSE